MKTNAKEYLKEFATSQQDWLQALIYDAIETNGNITDERKNKIFKHLINGADLSVTEPNISNETSESEIYITKLVHKSGIQALKEEQTIKFTKDITILYGLNGAGKSSYFKVLNEIVGGNQQKEILPNIYTETPKPIEIELVFKKNKGENKILNWNGSTRSLDLLNKCKVFDTSYLNGLLETRKADATLIQPLSLNLFSYLVTLMDEFKQQLTSKANEKKLEKPILELDYLNDEIKESFENHLISDSIKSQVEKFYTFSDEDSNKLSKTETKLSTLKQINIQDKIRLKNIDKTDIDAIMAYIKSTHKKLSDFYLDAQTQLKLLDKNKNTSELAKKQFEILSTIPNNDNSEWKKFIRSGEEYKSKVNDSDKICIYCRQSLQDENATKLIKSYAEFLKDASEQKLNNSLEKIENLKNKVEALSVELTIKERIQKILQRNRLKESEVTFHETIVKANANFSVEKEELLNKVKEEDQTLKNNLFDIQTIIKKLNSISDEIKVEVNEMSAEETKKNDKIKEVEKSLKQLQENKSINKQQENIKKWFELDKLTNSLKDKADEINTTNITNVSTRAHNDLLTETLKQNFANELNALGYESLNVEIENASSKKGISSTKLILLKNNNIKSILSEGEQKAVALALFIAESKIQKNKNPIILDDPVNSLDHKIAGKFAQQLLNLDNQIILFNHNKLFLDEFETSKENHICKSIDSDCSKSKGKHIKIYQVNSEGRNAKGVLVSYKSNKAKEHILKAGLLLNKSPFENKPEVAILLRKTVECAIDEVIFNNQLPTKYSNSNSRINWGELKKLGNDSATIDKLKKIHGRVSGGEMHNGTENEENPIEVEEFKVMINNIKAILNPSVNEKTIHS